MELLLEEHNWKKPNVNDELASYLYYIPSFPREQNDKEAFAQLKQITGFTSAEFYRMCAHRTK